MLERQGYRLTGIYRPGAGRIGYQALAQPPRDHALYLVDLPSLAPVAVQADWLAAYLQDLQTRQPGPLTLVGHSAGGVVARMALVRHRLPQVTRLITIAAPHLGTWRASQALDAIDDSGFFGIARRWEVKRRIGSPLYHTLKASRGLLHDLTPPHPGSLLFWLNAQPHPDIEYISIIRTGSPYAPGDRVVPPFSQDMRLVPAIGRRARAYTTPQGHMLSPKDGLLIAALLAETPPK
jgi:pimeloyl-ACP methyl ester carboxylesterase